MTQSTSQNNAREQRKATLLFARRIAVMITKWTEEQLKRLGWRKPEPKE